MLLGDGEGWLVSDSGIERVVGGTVTTRRTLGQEAGAGHAGRQDALKGWDVHGGLWLVGLSFWEGRNRVTVTQMFDS
jgi:hypothetical protein